MKRPDTQLLFKKSKGKPLTLEIYEEIRDVGSLATSMKKTSVVVKNDLDVKMIESKKGFVGWVL